VTGFDDVLAASLSRPPLTTVRQPMQRIGTTAVRALVGRLSGRGEDRGRRVVPVELTVRESCGCPPQARH
jgi:LacI family transcriptional regulator